MAISEYAAEYTAGIIRSIEDGYHFLTGPQYQGAREIISDVNGERVYKITRDGVVQYYTSSGSQSVKIGKRNLNKIIKAQERFDG